MKTLMLIAALVALATPVAAKPMHCTVTMKTKVVADEPCEVEGTRPKRGKGAQTVTLKSGAQIEFGIRDDGTAFASFGEVSDIMEWKKGCWRDDDAAQWSVCWRREAAR